MTKKIETSRLRYYNYNVIQVNSRLGDGITIECEEIEFSLNGVSEYKLMYTCKLGGQKYYEPLLGKMLFKISKLKGELYMIEKGICYYE